MATARKFATALLAGAIMVSGAWAGASLVPVDEAKDSVTDGAVSAVSEGQEPAAATPAAAPPEASADLPAPPPDPSSLAAGQVLAGAAKTSILPRPEDYDGTWEQRQEKCATLSENAFTQVMDDPAEAGDHLASTGPT